MDALVALFTLLVAWNVVMGIGMFIAAISWGVWQGVKNAYEQWSIEHAPHNPPTKPPSGKAW